MLTLPDGRRVRVVGVHPHPPLSEKVGEWQAALESLPRTGAGAPWILAGDFNATLDHAELRDVLDRGYEDAGDVTGKGLEPDVADDGAQVPAAVDHDRPRAHRPPPLHRRIRRRRPPRQRHRAIHAEIVLPSPSRRSPPS
jgi:endonuclease/exonuclease/phosphatase family metal-dependent hydrolase